MEELVEKLLHISTKEASDVDDADDDEQKRKPCIIHFGYSKMNNNLQHRDQSSFYDYCRTNNCHVLNKFVH